MNKKIAALELSNIHYQMYDEGEMKEYGLTREERLKKQFIEQRIDELYKTVILNNQQIIAIEDIYDLEEK